MTENEFDQISSKIKAKHHASVELLLRHVHGPVVYLLDENHSSVDVIRDNIGIAGTLIQDLGVTLVAVEGIEGDRLSWRDLKSPDPSRCFGVCHFGEQIVRNPKVEVVGVDSFKLFKIIEQECGSKGLPPANHPAQEQRSQHMLDSLLLKLEARPMVMAAILNGGTRHNDDIAKAIAVINANGAPTYCASFIRIRSKFYPEP